MPGGAIGSSAIMESNMKGDQNKIAGVSRYPLGCRLTFVCLKTPDVRTLERRNAGGGLLRREVRKMEGSEGSFFIFLFFFIFIFLYHMFVDF